MSARIWNIYSYLTFLAPSIGRTTNSNLKGRQEVFKFHALLFKLCYTPRAGIQPLCLKLFLCIDTAPELYAFSEAHTLYTLSFHSSGTKGRHKKTVFFTFSQETETPASPFFDHLSFF